ncbi:hypothetical protein LEP1GSC016_2055 [Leptospira borgpetersenii serovar Hardjo-bovis str. Sponselee]|uniref:Uncharacterized protein n=1 Tax=Leptospira borgpetersenii serovar Hardjo-bovis str. Sponselee TaxID=1303729 RepID=M6BCH1_LEPBO|nr:hypothetical protein LEP1GSC016_2055 [Leptospira borgpetersenii serovar Hardjo-bovis str. Sponselee]
MLAYNPRFSSPEGAPFCLYRIHVIYRATTTEFGGLAFTVV